MSRAGVGAASRAAKPWATPIKLTSINAAKSLAENPASGVGRWVPALRIARAIGPISALTRAITAAVASGSVTSRTKGGMAPAGASRTRTSKSAAVRALTATRQPSAANAKATARPIPFPDPVTQATRPLPGRRMLCLLRWLGDGTG